MGQVPRVTRVRGRRAWLLAIALAGAVGLALSACSATSEPPPVKVIADKGTPFGDLLVPKLTASVTDGAVGVAVDSPVTVSAEYGVLGSVTMVNAADGEPVAGRLSPDGLRWTTTEPLGYNERYTLSARSLGLGGATSQQMTFQTHSPENLTMPYVLPNEGEVVGVGSRSRSGSTRTSPTGWPPSRPSRSRPTRPSKARSTGSTIAKCVGAPPNSGSPGPRSRSR